MKNKIKKYRRSTADGHKGATHLAIRKCLIEHNITTVVILSHYDVHLIGKGVGHTEPRDIICRVSVRGILVQGKTKSGQASLAVENTSTSRVIEKGNNRNTYKWKEFTIKGVEERWKSKST